MGDAQGAVSGKSGSGGVRYAVIVAVCSDSSQDVMRSRLYAAMRTIRRHAFTSLTASPVSEVRA